MGIYFRKRIKILPGVHMNVSKSGTSWSVGPRGAKVNFGKRGTYITTGIPGTGIYARTKISGNTSSKPNTKTDSGYEIKNYTGCLFSFVCYALAFIMLLCGVPFIASIACVLIGFVLHLSSVEKKKEVLKNNQVINENMEIPCSTEIQIEDAVSTNDEGNNAYNETEQHQQESSNAVDMTRLDSLFEEAARLIVIHQQGSTSLIQRKFSIGYNRSGRIMDQLEHAGIVSAPSGIKPREVLCKDENELDYLLNNLDTSKFNPSLEEDDIVLEEAPYSEASRLIKLGIDLEKEKMIDESISVYEKAIVSQLPVTHPYNRLMILYRKKKDYENEIRIINIAIRVFMKENERRAGRIIDNDSSLYNQVMQALETNESIRYEDGKWAFVQYDVMEYIARLEKAKKLLEKSKSTN